MGGPRVNRLVQLRIPANMVWQARVILLVGWHDSYLGSRRADVDPERGVATPAVFAGVVAGLMVAATFRKGAFYPADAALVLVVSLVVATALLLIGPDKRAVAVVAASAGCRLWWFVRAAAQGRAGRSCPWAPA